MNNEYELIEKDEMEQILQEEELDNIKIKRYAFNSFRIEKSIDDILKWRKNDKIIIPEFQRDFVWTYAQCCKFIESILLGLPIPDFFMFREVDIDNQTEKYLLIDGLQRFKTIEQFTHGIYACKGEKKPFRITIKNSDYYNKSYADLSDNDKEFFADYSLKINSFSSVDNNEKSRKMYMTEIFERINTGSSKLTEQEVRNAIYVGDLVKKLKEISTYENFNILLSGDKNKYLDRCKNQEFILRLLAYYNIYIHISYNNYFEICGDDDSKFTSSKARSLNDFMFYSNKDVIDFNSMLEKLVKTFDYLASKIPTAFCTVKRIEYTISNKIHEVFSEALIILLMVKDFSQYKLTQEILDELKINLWRNYREKRENNFFFESTTSLENVKSRVEYLDEQLRIR